MSRNRMSRQNGDNFTRGMVTQETDGPGAVPSTKAAAKGAAETSGGVTVRVIRQHDTADGMKMPREEYQRSKGSAATLASQGIVEVLS